MDHGEAEKLLLDAYSVSDAQLELVSRLMHLDGIKDVRAKPLTVVARQSSSVNLEACLARPMTFEEFEAYMRTQFEGYRLNIHDADPWRPGYSTNIFPPDEIACVGLRVKSDGNV